MLRHCFPHFRAIFETSRIKWQNSTPLFGLLPKQKNKNINFNEFPRVRIEPTTVAFKVTRDTDPKSCNLSVFTCIQSRVFSTLIQIESYDNFICKDLIFKWSFDKNNYLLFLYKTFVI